MTERISFVSNAIWKIKICHWKCWVIKNPNKILFQVTDIQSWIKEKYPWEICKVCLTSLLPGNLGAPFRVLNHFWYNTQSICKRKLKWSHNKSILFMRAVIVKRPKKWFKKNLTKIVWLRWQYYYLITLIIVYKITM